MTFQERLDKANELQICTNCFSRQHTLIDCKHPKRCNHCHGKDHTLLHKDRKLADDKEVNPINKQREELDTKVAGAATAPIAKKRQVLLGTTIVYIEHENGEKIPCRAFLDSGSTVCFLRNESAQMLKLHKQKLTYQLVALMMTSFTSVKFLP